MRIVAAAVIFVSLWATLTVWTELAVIVFANLLALTERSTKIWTDLAIIASLIASYWICRIVYKRLGAEAEDGSGGWSMGVVFVSSLALLLVGGFGTNLLSSIKPEVSPAAYSGPSNSQQVKNPPLTEQTTTLPKTRFPFELTLPEIRSASGLEPIEQANLLAHSVVRCASLFYLLDENAKRASQTRRENVEAEIKALMQLGATWNLQTIDLTGIAVDDDADNSLAWSKTDEQFVESLNKYRDWINAAAITAADLKIEDSLLAIEISGCSKFGKDALEWYAANFVSP